MLLVLEFPRFCVAARSGSGDCFWGFAVRVCKDILLMQPSDAGISKSLLENQEETNGVFQTVFFRVVCLEGG